MKNLIELLHKEEKFREQLAHANFQLNDCENDEYYPTVYELERRLLKLNKKIVKALNRDLAERTLR